MAFKDGEMHVVATLGAIIMSAALILPAVMFEGKSSTTPPEEAHKPPLEDMEAIEASIAVKAEPLKQPQKEFRAPEEEVKDEGVARKEEVKPPDKKDEKKPPKKPDPKEKPPKKPPDRTKNLDEDTPVGEQKPKVGAFNTNERGFAEVTKGHPFFQQLAADINHNWSFPKILGANTKNPSVGCLHMNADGKIEEWKVDPKSDNDDLNSSVEAALKSVEKLRDEKPTQVPTELLKQATTRWICFKFDPQKAE